MIGDTLGGWHIDRELGRGGMGRVYLAHDSKDGREAAVKVLVAELAQEPGFLQRFEREIDALRQLSHPNIVKFFEAGCEGGKYFYVMEHVPGQTFEELLHAHGRLPWPEALDAGLQICPALKHAHDRGVVHRDLKPPNIMRTPDGVVKLMDFGIAKVFSGPHLTATGGIVGTAEYLSPEQASGKPATRRSDLYSLGVVLYTLLTGRTPFEGPTFVDLLHKHRFGQFDPPHKIVPEVPYEFDEIICNLLAKDPSERPADAQVALRLFDGVKRKLERKAQATNPGPVKDQTLADRRDGGSEALEEGAAPLMSRQMRHEVDQNHGSTINQLFNRPIVVLPLFLLCVGIIVWAFLPRPESDPVDNEKPAASEAGRLFREGVRMNLAGNTGAAQRSWEDVIVIFEGVESEQGWVRLARKRLEELRKETDETRWTPVEAALKRARALRDRARALLEQKKPLAAQKKRSQAEAIWAAIARHYTDDPSASKIMQEMKRDRAK